MFCRYCGESIEEGSTFCMHCGKKLEENAKENIYPDKKISKMKGKHFLLLVVFASVFAIIVCVGFWGILGVQQQKRKCELGEVYSQYELLKPVLDSTQILFEDNYVANEIGKNRIKYKVKNGILQRTGMLSIEVVDSRVPTISGPEELIVEVGEEFDFQDYYLIEDNDSQLDIHFRDEIDFRVDGKYDTAICVSDTVGNEATLEIKLEVVKLTNYEKVAKKVIAYCNKNNCKTNFKTGCIVYRAGTDGTNGVTYYVMSAAGYPKSDLYAIYEDGSVKEFTVLDAGSTNLFELLEYAILMDGTFLETRRICK